jgi:hypothetical protein
MKVRGVGLGTAVIAFLLSASVALAQEPTGPAYGGSGPNIDAQVGGAAAGQGGSLPFTGLDVTLALVAGCLLVMTGLVARRVARSRRTSE